VAPTNAWLYHFYRIAHDATEAVAVVGSAMAVATLAVTDILPSSPALTKYTLGGIGIVGVIMTLCGLLLTADKS
jgi:hypothetical protein